MATIVRNFETGDAVATFEGDDSDSRAWAWASKQRALLAVTRGRYYLGAVDVFLPGQDGVLIDECSRPDWVDRSSDKVMI